MGKESIQPEVLRDEKGNVMLCGYLEKSVTGFFCKALEEELSGKLGPIQSPKCPLEENHTRACEVKIVRPRGGHFK